MKAKDMQLAQVKHELANMHVRGEQEVSCVTSCTVDNVITSVVDMIT